MKRYLLIIALLIIIAGLAYRLDTYHSAYTLVGELMYFPSGNALRTLSIGLYAPLADIIWLRFIQYYGEHRLSDSKYELMYHILDILTDCDPYFLYAYTLGSLMLAHDAALPDQAKKILYKAMQKDPDEWRYPFQYGFIHYVFLGEFKTAHRFFRLASMKPNAPDMPKRWAAFTAYMKIGDLETSLKLWFDLYRSTQNPEEKAIAEYYIMKIKMKIDIENLNDAVQKYEEKYDRPPLSLNDLIRTDIIDSLPLEPHGKKYVLINNLVKSTWE